MAYGELVEKQEGDDRIIQQECTVIGSEEVGETGIILNREEIHAILIERMERRDMVVPKAEALEKLVNSFIMFIRGDTHSWLKRGFDNFVFERFGTEWK